MMDKKKILKILGFIVGPLVVMAIAAFFLYPYLNEGKYEEVAEKYQDDKTTLTADGNRIGRDFETLVEQVKDLQAGNGRLQSLVDSLRKTNEELQTELDKQQEKLEEQQQAKVEESPQDEMATAGRQEAATKNEDIAEQVKSLLSLEDEALSPIVSELSDEQLLRLYQSGGTIQRKKLLRTLKPKRAAQLMEKVML